MHMRARVLALGLAGQGPEQPGGQPPRKAPSSKGNRQARP